MSLATESIWRDAGLPADALSRLDLCGAEPVLPSSFAVGTAAQASLAAAALAATEIGRVRNGVRQRVAVDMPQIDGYVSLIWPPAGIALAALVRWGLRLWPAVGLGTFAVALSAGHPPALALLLAAGSTAGPVLGAWLLHRRGLHPALDRRRDLWLFTVFGVGLSDAEPGTVTDA